MPRHCLMLLPLLLLAACGDPTASPTGGSPESAEAPAETTASESADPGAVVIYTSVDQNFSEPVLRAFEAETGITVKPVFDVEAAKTTGLVNRLVAEKDRPQADVWWNGEFAQTIDLAKQGVLAPYTSPNAADIPAEYKDPDGAWTGFGGRARVILVNTERMADGEMPDSIWDFMLTNHYEGPMNDHVLEEPLVPQDQIGIAYPVFGTTATHAAALYALRGRSDAFEILRRMVGVRVLDGNGAVRDLVVDGQLAYGLTDTDDACGALEKGAPVKVVFPDQEEGGMGTLLIPNTVGLVAGGPNPEAGQRLIDYLLSREVEARLVESGWSQIAFRPLPADVAAAACIDAGDVRGMSVGLTEVAEHIEEAKTDMAELFVR